MNNFPQYDSYKDSGINLFGNIPEHWETIKIKYVCNIYNGNSIKDEKKDSYERISESAYPYISTKDIDLNSSKIDYENGLRIPSNEKNFKIAPKNSFLLCIEGGSAGKKIGYLNEEVCFVNKLACFHTLSNYSSKFTYFFVNSSSFQVQFEKSLNGLIGGVSISQIKNFDLILPPVSEQIAITEFLDSKTAQIDQAIVQKERLIVLLQERRELLIYNAVTRGINPNTKMNHSGDWIGEIPDHWQVVSNFALFEERNEPGREDLPILMVSIHTAVSSDEVSDEDNIRGKVRIEDKTSYKLVKPGDIVFNMMRAWQGAIGAVKNEGMVSPAYIVAKPKREFSSIFLEFQFRTQDYIQQIDRYSKGITDFRKRLYWNEFKRLKTILPPIEEQRAISEFITNLNEKIEKAIAAKRKEIEKLKEYKTVLINSAVIGKIKVCNQTQNVEMKANYA